VSTANNEKSAANQLRVDSANDLALLKTEVKSDTFAKFRASIRLGEEIAIFGYPLSGLLASGGNFTLGNVTALAGLGDDTRELQISAPVQSGNSGGPLLDYNGAVVGVVTSKLNVLRAAALTRDFAQNVNFAIKSSVVIAFLEAAGLSVALAESGERLQPADLADRGRAIAVQVGCWK
jgi:S1-C subfamily serine protease